MSVEAAMEWLLLHPEAQEPDASATDVDESAVSAIGASQSATSATGASQSTTSSTSASQSQPTAETHEGASKNSSQDSCRLADVRPKSEGGAPSPSVSRRQSKAQTILESFRAYKRRKFKPNLTVCYTELTVLSVTNEIVYTCILVILDISVSFSTISYYNTDV